MIWQLALLKKCLIDIDWSYLLSEPIEFRSFIFLDNWTNLAWGNSKSNRDALSRLIEITIPTIPNTVVSNNIFNISQKGLFNNAYCKSFFFIKKTINSSRPKLRNKPSFSFWRLWKEVMKGSVEIIFGYIKILGPQVPFKDRFVGTSAIVLFCIII